MAIFAVMGLGDVATVGAKIKEKFPDDHYVVASDKWFISANGVTAQNVAEQIGMNVTDKLLGIVVSVGGYNGMASQNIWEWLKVKGTKASA
jgi:hypothetical protein